MQVIRHSEDALRTALISQDRKLAKLFEENTPGERRLLSEAFREDSALFKHVTIHSDSDWIPSHSEHTQDFEEFYKDPCRNMLTSKRSIIYVQPIGSFGDSEVTTEDYIGWLKDYCESFYYGLTVKILAPVSVSETECVFRVNQHTENLQIHAGGLLSYLKKRKPKDAYCIVGITMMDLYPRESWNFVFGQASLTEGVGIFSFARYDSNFYSKNYEGKVVHGKQVVRGDYSVFDGYYTPPVTGMLLLRSCKALLRWIDEGVAEANSETGYGAQGCTQKPVEEFKEHHNWIQKCLSLLQT
ncbi:archaemetzincin-2 isoform X2 [Ambystoma mexicanum]|uniref:archaemetzincin-2 isoform X2 n=1 Tax=Ambystoma mexicanum TaxID=8296 RepID=UPI0037E8CE88